MHEEKLIKELRGMDIIDIVGDALSIQDTNFKILYQNKLHKDMVGDRVGEYCYKAYQDQDDICEGCKLDVSLKDGNTHIMERSRTTREGIMYFENTTSPLRDSKGIIMAGIEIFRDITERKRIEELEKHVEELTEELEKTNEKLLSEINGCKKIEENFRYTEEELITHLKKLTEANTALKVLLEQRENDKKEFENNILSNIKHLIFPYLEKLKTYRSMSEELDYLDKIESNLKEIVSPFSSKLLFKYSDLTPKEIQIADLIKDGKQDKDIMKILNISPDTVKAHRKNIRKKLGIYGKRVNLRSKLLSFTK